MDQTKCCENCDKCSCSGGKCQGKMECCNEHASSREHLEMKKQMLEEKLQSVNEALEKAE